MIQEVGIDIRNATAKQLENEIFRFDLMPNAILEQEDVATIPIHARSNLNVHWTALKDNAGAV